MLKYFSLFVGLQFTCFGQNVSLLSVTDFQQKLTLSNDAQILDIRSAVDFQLGHLRKAKNIDYKKADFEQIVQIKLDKKAPVFLYCFSGGQSVGAATFLKSLGFREVYELDGGFAKWTASSKPYTASSNSKPIAALTVDNIHTSLYNHELVLLDFYATWCGPCKKMSPILEKISRENPNLYLLKIEADKNDGIANKFEVEEIPTYILFKNGKQIWRSTGIVPEAEMKAIFKKHQTKR
jgi:thioredoxin 1